MVDDCVGDFLPLDVNGFVGSWSVAKRSGLPEDAQSHITHRQAGDDVRLLDGLLPSALVDGWGGRFRGRSGLQLENIHRAVEPGSFTCPALPPGRSVRHESPPQEKRMICYCGCAPSDRLHRENLFVA